MKKRWPWIAAVVGIMVAIAVAVVAAWLLLSPEAMSDERAQIAAVQAVAAIGFGVGGLGTLMLFVRRQWLQEQAHDLARQRADLEQRKADDDRHDATERRITELYMTAAEQLSHDKAPVRMAALHALDRLGQNEPHHRQVVAGIWCSYLRQPFTPPARFASTPSSMSVSDAEDDDSVGVAAGSVNTVSDGGVDPAELEYEVRATAQRLLARHLNDSRHPKHKRDDAPPIEPGGFWGPIRIDLTRACLVGADFSTCWLADITFTETQFHGDTAFVYTKYSGASGFGGARFRGHVAFSGPSFDSEAAFAHAQFDGGAQFNGVDFATTAKFSGVRFAGGSDFIDTQFNSDARFDGARFQVGSGFDHAWFGEDTTFLEAWFHKITYFDEQRFAAGVSFTRTHFESEFTFHHCGAVRQECSAMDSGSWAPAIHQPLRRVRFSSPSSRRYRGSRASSVTMSPFRCGSPDRPASWQGRSVRSWFALTSDHCY